MHRFPGGAAGSGFWHKQLPDHAPDWVPRWHNPDAERGKTDTYLVVDEPAALVWAANFGALEWHAWTALATPKQPDVRADRHRPRHRRRPGRTCWCWPGCTAQRWSTSACAAQPKVTGRRGIQIWIPVSAGLAYEDTRGWVEQLSKAIGAVVPELVSWKWDVSERGGLARLDYTQNVSNKTLVAPYSPRAAPARRSRRRSAGTSSTIRRCGRTDSRSAPCTERVALNLATCSGRYSAAGNAAAGELAGHLFRLTGQFGAVSGSVPLEYPAGWRRGGTGACRSISLQNGRLARILGPRPPPTRYRRPR